MRLERIVTVLLIHIFVVISCVILLTTCTKQNQNEIKLVIDNDAGGDDAMAIFLALLYQKYFNGPELIALTTANGNTFEDNVSYNNQRILKVANSQNVPIYRGAKRSIVTTPLSSGFYGEDGLGDNNETVRGLMSPEQQKAVSALLDLSKTYGDDLIVVCIGALTNIALAISIDPLFLGRIKQLYVGAGHIYNDVNNAPEFNAHMDVEAYHIVAQNSSPDKVTILPYSQVFTSLNFTRSWREDVLGTIDSDIMRAQNLYERVSLKKYDMWHALDPAVVAVAIKPELVEEYKYSKNDIIMCSDERGINTNRFVDKEDANARLVYAVKTEMYKQFLLDVFSTYTKRNSNN